MQVLLVKPGRAPRKMELKNDLDAMQRAVGGLLQVIYPFEEPVALVCNDEGKLLGLPANRGLWDEKGRLEVYFIQDNIWTMDGDGELRLTIMATMAQEESRKISERVRAGQKISREKGVLYGTGNILGYDRVGDTYQINPEQAYAVRKIFQLYDQGWGYKRICAELVRLGCKNANGNVEWSVDRIGRILRNATYKGYIGYNKSHSDGYLTQKRVNHRDEEFTY